MSTSGLFDVLSNTIKNIVEGKDPRIVASTNEITSLRETGMYKSKGPVARGIRPRA
jgi:hypothetical protein